jgi:tellurite resistance protein
MDDELSRVRVEPPPKKPGFFASLFGGGKAKPGAAPAKAKSTGKSSGKQQARKPVMDFGLNAGWSKEEAFLCVLLAAALADNAAHDLELEEIDALFHRLNIFEKQPKDKIAELRQKVQAKLQPEAGKPMKSDTWKSAAKTLTKNSLGAAAFANAADIVFADRVVESEEVEFLRELIGELGVEAQANDIIRVIKLKNHHAD